MSNEKFDPVADKSMEFAVRIVNLYKYLIQNHSEYVLSKQLLRSGTSIGANIREAEHAHNREQIFLQKCTLLSKKLLNLLTGLNCLRRLNI